jgi:hypothetical protein
MLQLLKFKKKLRIYFFEKKYVEYLMKHNLVNHSVNCYNDAKWNQNHTEKSENLIICTDDIMIKALGNQSIFMPSKRQKSDNKSGKPANKNFQIHTALFIAIFHREQNRLKTTDAISLNLIVSSNVYHKSVERHQN